MKIGDGASDTITHPTKQGGLVAIYYLGTLIGALMYVIRISTLEYCGFSDSVVSKGRRSLRQDWAKQGHRLWRHMGHFRNIIAVRCSELQLDALR